MESRNYYERKAPALPSVFPPHTICLQGRERRKRPGGDGDWQREIRPKSPASAGRKVLCDRAGTTGRGHLPGRVRRLIPNARARYAGRPLPLKLEVITPSQRRRHPHDPGDSGHGGPSFSQNTAGGLRHMLLSGRASKLFQDAVAAGADSRYVRRPQDRSGRSGLLGRSSRVPGAARPGRPSYTRTRKGCGCSSGPSRRSRSAWPVKEAHDRR